MAEYNKYNHPPGLNHVGSYQVSGTPYITGSASMASNEEDKIEFPFVTNNFTVINTGTKEIRVSFASTTSAHVEEHMHYVSLNSQNDSVTFSVKCKDIYINNNTTFKTI